jgi:hypothetical protein
MPNTAKRKPLRPPKPPKEKQENMEMPKKKRPTIRQIKLTKQSMPLKRLKERLKMAQIRLNMLRSKLKERLTMPKRQNKKLEKRPPVPPIKLIRFTTTLTIRHSSKSSDTTN